MVDWLVCLFVGWLVGWQVGWLVVGLVGSLVVFGGWWVGFGLQNCSKLLGTTPSDLGRKCLGAGGGMLWLGWWDGVSEVSSLERKLKKTHCFFFFF